MVAAVFATVICVVCVLDYNSDCMNVMPYTGLEQNIAPKVYLKWHLQFYVISPLTSKGFLI